VDQRPLCRVPTIEFAIHLVTPPEKNPRARVITAKRVGLSLSAAVLLVLLFLSIQRIMDVAAVQNSVRRDFEIGFGQSDSIRPPVLPKLLDDAAESILTRLFKDRLSYNRDWPPHSTVRQIIYQERFRALFRGPIRELHVYYCEAFTGDLGAALSRFPNLRSVTVFENEPDVPTEADMALLCKRLRTFPHLEELELGGSWVTDAAIAPLAGHPKLKSVTISYGRLTAGCVKTFSSIPHLTELHIGEQIYDGAAWLSPEDQRAMSAALPGVTIEFP
jgi:hypothetical protein